MSLGTRFIDPRESRRFAFNFTNDLGDDTISTVVIEAPDFTQSGAGIVTDSGDRKVSVLLTPLKRSGLFIVRATVVTVAGQRLSRSGLLRVGDL